MQEIKKIRTARGLSQERLAFMANVNKVTLVHIETGQVSPKVETLEKIAAALDVEVGDFFPKAQSALQLWPYEIGREESAVIEALKGLNERLAALRLLGGNEVMGAVAFALIHNVGQLIPALMKNEALAEELRPVVARTAEIGRALLEGAGSAEESPEELVATVQVIDALERLQAA